jgi:hypothetical protein
MGTVVRNFSASLVDVILSEAKDLREAMDLFPDAATNRKSLRVNSSLRSE